MDHVYDLHASELHRWTRCERGQVWRVAHPDAAPEAEHVAGWIGSSVHAIAAGEPEPDPPELMRMDSITPTLAQARMQIRRMGVRIREFIDDYGWRVIGRELPCEVKHLYSFVHVVGRLDLKVAVYDGKSIIDLKTGALVEGVWLQLGTYGLAHPDVNHVGALLFPRVKLTEDMPKPEYIERPAKECEADALHVVGRVAKLLSDPDSAIPAPGMWCASCAHPTCAVRAHPRKD